MRLARETRADVALLTPHLESLDAQTAPEFLREVCEVLDAPRVLLDLSEVCFVDSSGLGAILACMRQVQAASGEFALCGLRPQVRATVELVRMHRLLEIHATADEGVAAFGPAPASANPRA